MTYLCTRTVSIRYMPIGRGRNSLVLHSVCRQSLSDLYSTYQSRQVCANEPRVLELCSGPLLDGVTVVCGNVAADTALPVSPQVLRQQMEVVQSQMQRLQAHREQEGAASEPAPGSSAQHASPPSTHVRAVPQPTAPAYTTPGTQPSGAPPAAGRAPPQPAGGQGSISSSNAADEVRQRRLQHFNTRE